jgi:hypothetical protein
LVRRGETLVATTVEHPEPSSADRYRCRCRQPRLADTGLPDDEHGCGTACGDRLQRRHEAIELLSSTEARGIGRLLERRRKRGPKTRVVQELEHLDGFLEARSSRSPTERSRAPARPRLRCTVAAATRTEPPAASAHSRLASIAAAPIQSSASLTRSPLLMPTRRASGVPTTVRRRAADCRAEAASRAATALVNVAITPSPTLFTTVPPAVATICRLARSSSAVRSSASASPTRMRHAVEPTRSVNNTVIVSGRPPGMRHRTFDADGSASPDLQGWENVQVQLRLSAGLSPDRLFRSSVPRSPSPLHVGWNGAHHTR